MKKLLFFLLVIVTNISCTTLKSGTAKSIDIVGDGVIYKPVIADLEVNQQKSSKTIKVKTAVSLETAKDDVIRELLNENNADILVEPKFQTISTNGRTELTVTGWLAYYKNFRPIEEKDLKFLNIRPSTVNILETKQNTINDKKK